MSYDRAYQTATQSVGADPRTFSPEVAQPGPESIFDRVTRLEGFLTQCHRQEETLVERLNQVEAGLREYEASIDHGHDRAHTFEMALQEARERRDARANMNLVSATRR